MALRDALTEAEAAVAARRLAAESLDAARAALEEEDNFDSNGNARRRQRRLITAGIVTIAEPKTRSGKPHLITETWGNPGKTQGKPGENPGKTQGKPGENPRKTRG